MVKKNKILVSEEQQGETPAHLAARIGDGLIFIGILVLTVMAGVLFALAAPVALAVSAGAGLFAKKDGRGKWRPAGA